MTGYIDIHTSISTEEYKRLHQLAKDHGTTVGALVAEITHRALTPKRRGRQSTYTPELGEQIWESRWMHRSWAQIAAEVDLSVATVRNHHARYEAETQNRSDAA